MEKLFETFDLGGLQLPNRMVMAPMTRTRATPDGAPTDLMRDYYVQRASAGLAHPISEVSLAELIPLVGTAYLPSRIAELIQ